MTDAWGCVHFTYTEWVIFWVNVGRYTILKILENMNTSQNQPFIVENLSFFSMTPFPGKKTTSPSLEPHPKKNPHG